MASIRDVADFFIRKVDQNAGDAMTHLRLQKLVYYSQAWSLAIREKPLFEGEFQAWPHGPVNIELWQEFKSFRFSPIPLSSVITDDQSISKDEKNFLGEVWRVYGGFSAKRLEEMTHAEDPWIKARGDLKAHEKSTARITNASMKKFYQAQLGKK